MIALETSPYFRDLDWEKLKVFYYVAKVGNISQAAPFLNLNQTSFSRYVTGLERHLGYPLFCRKVNGVTLTRKGEELLIIVETIFLKMKGFTSRRHQSLGVGLLRKIRIAAPHDLAAYLINSLLLDYNKDRPDLVFEVIEVDDPLDVILHDVDLTIQSYDPKREKVEDANWRVVQEPFFTLEKKLYASPQYLEKQGEPQEVGDLKHHTFIALSIPQAYPFGDAKWILDLGIGGLVSNHERREPMFMSNSLECLIEAAQQGKGIIGAYDKLTILKNANLHNILPDLIIKKQKLYFVYPTYLKDDQDIMDIKGYLKEKVGEFKS